MDNKINFIRIKDKDEFINNNPEWKTLFYNSILFFMDTGEMWTSGIYFNGDNKTKNEKKYNTPTFKFCKGIMPIDAKPYHVYPIFMEQTPYPEDAYNSNKQYLIFKLKFNKIYDLNDFPFIDKNEYEILYWNNQNLLDGNIIWLSDTKFKTPNVDLSNDSSYKIRIIIKTKRDGNGYFLNKNKKLCYYYGKWDELKISTDYFYREEFYKLLQSHLLHECPLSKFLSVKNLCRLEFLYYKKTHKISHNSHSRLIIRKKFWHTPHGTSFCKHCFWRVRIHTYKNYKSDWIYVRLSWQWYKRLKPFIFKK